MWFRNELYSLAEVSVYSSSWFLPINIWVFWLAGTSSRSLLLHSIPSERATQTSGLCSEVQFSVLSIPTFNFWLCTWQFPDVCLALSSKEPGTRLPPREQNCSICLYESIWCYPVPVTFFYSDCTLRAIYVMSSRRLCYFIYVFLIGWGLSLLCCKSTWRRQSYFSIGSWNRQWISVYIIL